MSFLDDIQVGQKGEDRFLFLLQRATLPFSRSARMSPYYDVQMEGATQTIRFELKYDRMQSQTGNICVEYHNPLKGKPSGVSVSEADLWVYVLDAPMSVWVVNLKRLRDFFFEVRPLKDIKRAGDGNASVRIYRTGDFLRICRRIDELDPSLLEGALLEELSLGSTDKTCGGCGGCPEKTGGRHCSLV